MIIIIGCMFLNKPNAMPVFCMCVSSNTFGINVSDSCNAKDVLIKNFVNWSSRIMNIVIEKISL